MGLASRLFWFRNRAVLPRLPSIRHVILRKEATAPERLLEPSRFSKLLLDFLPLTLAEDRLEFFLRKLGVLKHQTIVVVGTEFPRRPRPGAQKALQPLVLLGTQ